MKAIETAIKYLYLKDGPVPLGGDAYYCKTRDQSLARLEKWMKYFVSVGIPSDQAAILTAILGELTNNCFDHNLGKWSIPGCQVTFERNLKGIFLCVVDQGQGIISSLRPALDPSYSPKEVLRQAFEERISGRSPEKRGNGLKFVSKYIRESSHNLLCCTQGEQYSIGNLETTLIDPAALPKNFGTLQLVHWRTP